MMITIKQDPKIETYYTGIKFNIFGRELFLFKKKRNYFEACIFIRKILSFIGINFVCSFYNVPTPAETNGATQSKYEMTMIPQTIKEDCPNGKN